MRIVSSSISFVLVSDTDWSKWEIWSTFVSQLNLANFRIKNNMLSDRFCVRRVQLNFRHLCACAIVDHFLQKHLILKLCRWATINYQNSEIQGVNCRNYQNLSKKYFTKFLYFCPFNHHAKKTKPLSYHITQFFVNSV